MFYDTIADYQMRFPGRLLHICIKCVYFGLQRFSLGGFIFAYGSGEETINCAFSFAGLSQHQGKQ